MAITKLNSLAIPAGTVEPADISYPLTNFSSTGIDDNATSNAITIDTNENVGIGGIASPQAPLHIYKTEASVGETDPIARFERFTTGDNAYLDITVDNNNNLIGFQSTGTSDGGFTFGGAAVERMRLTSAGKLGILTNNPARELDIKLADDTTTTLGQKGGINFYAPSNTVGNGGELTWSSAINGEVWAAISGHIVGNSSGVASGELIFATANSAALPTERMRIDDSGNVIFNQIIANATAPYASTDSFIQLYNSTAAKTGTLATANNGNTWLNADGGKTLWLNWASYSSPASYADIMLGDGNEGNFILHIDGSTGCINTNGNASTAASSQAERGSIFVGSSFGANISGDNGGGGMFASNVVLNSSNVAKVAFAHTGGYGYAGVHTGWGAINFYGSRASSVAAGDTPQYVAQFLANSSQSSHPEQRYFGTSSRLIERRNFYQTYSQATGQTYWHFKTNISWGGTSQMYAIHFTGQNYNGSKVIDLNLSFYNYIPSGQPINVGSSSHTNDSATVYESSDGYIVLRYQFNSGNTYYSSIILSQYDTAQGLQTFTVSASAASSTAAYY